MHTDKWQFAQYQVGDRLWYRNKWNQSFCGEIVHVQKPDCLLIKRDDKPDAPAEDIKPLEYPVTRHFPKT